MPKFSQSSFSKLSTCHPDLQALFFEVIREFDCTIIQGYRDKAGQDAAFAAGKTQLKWPHGKHNSQPSMAVDVAPCELDGSIEWGDRRRFDFFAGWVLGIASQLRDKGKMTLSVRWGGDWNRNTEVTDNNFNDLVHFELV